MSAAQTIVIAAGDLSGYMAAAYLRRMLPRQTHHVIMLCGPSLAHGALYGLAHGDIRRINALLKIKEPEFIAACDAVFRLGTQISGFGKAPYARTFAPYGLPVEGVGFYDALIAQGRSPHPANIVDYSLPAALIAANKFTPPADSSKPILSDYDYGYAFDAQLYAKLLTQKVEHFGASIYDLETSKIDIRTGRCNINGVDIAADLIINAGAGLDQDNWTDWSDSIPFGGYDMAIYDGAVPSPKVAPLVTAGEDCITLSYDVQHQNYIATFKHSGQFSYPPGRTETPWVGRVLKLGSAALHLLPVEGNLTQIAQLDLERLIELFPPNLTDPVEREEYNRRTQLAYDRQRDFVLLHLKTSRASGAIWETCRAMTLPQEAAYKLSLFKARGRIAVLDEENPLKDSWHAMLFGHDILPVRADAMAMNITAKQLDAALSPLADFIARAVDAMPLHGDFIARHCPAPSRKPS